MNVVTKGYVIATGLLVTAAIGSTVWVTTGSGHSAASAAGTATASAANPSVSAAPSAGQPSRAPKTAPGTGAGGGPAAPGPGTTPTPAPSGSPSPTGTPPLHLTIRPIIAPPSLHLPVVTTLPSPSGTIGAPGVPCLQGYVWRQAFKGDYVCVTPGVRAQAAADNLAAPGRVEPGGGAYGPYTCQQGYVWRQVVPDDYVCVTPGVRAQAAADNAQADNRAALLRLWLSDWNPPQQQQQHCTGQVCSTSQGFWQGPDFQVNGDHFNFGHVILEIRRNNGPLLWWGLVTAHSYPGFAGGAFGVHTPIGDCSSVPAATSNDYAVAYDTVSHRWSNRVPVTSGCGSL